MNGVLGEPETNGLARCEPVVVVRVEPMIVPWNDAAVFVPMIKRPLLPAVPPAPPDVFTVLPAVCVTEAMSFTCFRYWMWRDATRERTATWWPG
jgi:hypothetical protein